MIKIDRLFFLGILISLSAVLIFFRLITIPSEGAYLVAEPVYVEVIKPDRGTIYDRDGYILAGNRMVYEVGVELNQVNSINGAETIAQETSRVLGVDYNLMKTRASIEFDPKYARYIVLEDFISPEKIDLLREVKISYYDNNSSSLNGLYWFPYLTRSYPENDLASNVLGFYAFWDRINGKPHYGIEEEYNQLLSGKKQSITYQLDPGKITELPQLPSGASLVLTIDREIQAMVERILDHAVEESGSKSGTIVVMQPETGEILAMAVNPRINPNEYEKSGETFLQEYSFNRAIDLNYEPGSVFKVITMAAALDSNVVERDTEYLDQGYYAVGGQVIQNWDRMAYGPQTMTGCMQHSLNVCLSWIAVEKLTAARFYSYLDAFGIGRRTNIDLAGERIYPLSQPGDSNWYEVNLATNSFGQGLYATPIQMITAISAVANDGKIMAPHVLKKVITSEQQFDIYPRHVASPISAETAHILTDMLAVSLEAEASNALVDGYRIAGKTGTGEISIPGQGYTTDMTNASFVGWGPVDDPKFIIYVWLEEPTSSKWGSVVAAPVFRKVASELVLLMGIPPDDVRMQLAAQ